MTTVTCRAEGDGTGCKCLSDSDWAEMYETIRADAYVGPPEPEPLEDATTYAIGGTPGSRKTTMIGLPLAQELEEVGRPFVRYNFDDQRPFNPHALETFPDTLAAEADPVKKQGRACVDEDIRRCLVELHSWAREKGIDIISEGAFENADYIKEHISKPDRAVGRKIHLRYSATSPAECWTGVMGRGIDAFEKTGIGRLNERGFFDTTTLQIPAAAKECRERNLVDAISASGGNGQIVNVAERIGGRWLGEPTEKAIHRERMRLRTPAETAAILGNLRRLDEKPATREHLGTATWDTERDVIADMAIPQLDPTTVLGLVGGSGSNKAPSGRAKAP